MYGHGLEASGGAESPVAGVAKASARGMLGIEIRSTESSGMAQEMTPRRYEDQKTVVVLGPPRSGTSMTAGLLSILGVDFGRVRKPDPLNPTGYWEDVRFLELCGSVMRTVDPNSHGLNPPSSTDVVACATAFRNRVRNLVAKRCREADGAYWGWKTTTTAFMMKLFLPEIHNPHCVVVLRRLDTIAASISAYSSSRYKTGYEPLDVAQSLEVAVEYYAEIARFCAANPQVPTIFVSYEDALQAPETMLKRLAVFLGREPTPPQLARAREFVRSTAQMQRLKRAQARKRTVRDIASGMVRRLGGRY